MACFILSVTGKLLGMKEFALSAATPQLYTEEDLPFSLSYGSVSEPAGEYLSGMW